MVDEGAIFCPKKRDSLMLVHEDLLQVRAPGVCFYVLKDREELYLIDGGFVGGRWFLARALRKQGWEDLPVIGILLTHGHLDHVLNVKKLADDKSAWVAGSKLDLAHFEGKATYTGCGKLTGFLESFGRTVFSYESFVPDRFLQPGEKLEIWGGLEVVALPGHTSGHVGFYSAERGMLFCGDTFASFGCFSHLPPRIFNKDSEENRLSFERVLEMDLQGVLPNHCWSGRPEKHLLALRKLAKKVSRL